jgi:hypothetical protein
MPYESVDALQRALTRDIFHYARDAKKAAGRALGTLVEIISFYLIKSWGYEKHTAIERRLPEYANPEITHNVEFSLHPSYELVSFQLPKSELPLTTRNSSYWHSHTIGSSSSRTLASPDSLSPCLSNQPSSTSR